MSGANHGVAERPFGVSAGQECLPNEPQVGCVVDTVVRFVVFESGGEFVGAIENFLCGSGHGGHLRYLGRAGMAWMMM